MKKKYLSFLFFSLLFTSPTLLAETKSSSISTDKVSIETYIFSESFSNLVPIKQIINDKWQQEPTKQATNAFTQNEIGVKLFWRNFSFTIAQRLDYFVFSDTDTAKAYYLLNTDKALTSQNNYKLDLQLLHQQSIGVRIGYKWQFSNFVSGVEIGYWNVQTVRDSFLYGNISGNNQNQLSGSALLTEFYSEQNYLKRPNNNSWETNGWGATVDFYLNWKANEQLIFDLKVNDLYSNFTLKNIGYSQGEINTDATFVNAVGGTGYLPLYRGVESSKNHQFNLPAKVTILGRYQQNNIDYLIRYKRQGNVNFYAIGTEFKLKKNTVRLMLDVKKITPEIQLTNKLFTLQLALDNINISQVMQVNLGAQIHYDF